jgi:hypothetical protein
MICKYETQTCCSMHCSTCPHYEIGNLTAGTQCEFCKKIWNSEKEYRNQFKRDWEERVAIVLDEDDEPALYIPVQDDYYSTTYLQINYCPKCGRKLIKR